MVEFVVVILSFSIFLFASFKFFLRETLYLHESHVSGNLFSKCFLFSLNLLFQECLSYEKRPCQEQSVCRAVENAE